MGDEQKKPTPHQAEQTQVAQQVGVIDAVNTMSNMVNGVFGGHVRFFGKTDFENHRLNDMIDMVESANPEHLETAGKALWDARDAINDAAQELSGHIDNVDWEGDSGQAFRDWGSGLVTYAVSLASFAEVAGTQISAAATGLASVRSAMPPRDTRLDTSQKPSDIPTPARVAGNEDYTAAVKVEKDRQEAINQMNRLSSFYSVSEETLAAQEAPTFPKAMPDVGVPKPTSQVKGVGNERARTNSGPGTTHEALTVSHDSSSVVGGHTHTVDVASPLKHVNDLPVQTDHNVGTKIDGVGTLPTQGTTTTPTDLPPSVTGSGGGNSGTVPPMATGGVPPAFGGPVGRTSAFGGASGSKGPISPQGRVGSPNGTASARDVTGPAGRAAGAGQSTVRGSGPAANRSPIGRGVTGGTPRPVGGRTGGGGSTGAARGNGVVGGKPATGAAPGSTGAKVPRGTVVGAEGNPGARTPAGRIGQRGVIGAPGSTPAARQGQPGRPVTSNPDGVVGTPNDRASTGKSTGLTGGAAGTAQGRTGNRRRTTREDRENECRAETQRRSTPPATD